MTPEDEALLERLLQDFSLDGDPRYLAAFRTLALEMVVAELLSKSDPDTVEHATTPGIDAELRAMYGDAAAVAFTNVFERLRFFLSRIHGISFPNS